jgi:hypothetical protein
MKQNDTVPIYTIEFSIIRMLEVLLYCELQSAEGRKLKKRLADAITNKGLAERRIEGQMSRFDAKERWMRSLLPPD